MANGFRQSLISVTPNGDPATVAAAGSFSHSLGSLHSPEPNASKFTTGQTTAPALDTYGIP